MPNPEKMAPATKYGGKIVVCQPGRFATAKSKETTVCTERTSGVLKPSQKQIGHFIIAPVAVGAAPTHRQDPVEVFPEAKVEFLEALSELVLALAMRSSKIIGTRSRMVARSGIIPMYQKRIETVP
jgi:hypothetical protein